MTIPSFISNGSLRASSRDLNEPSGKTSLSNELR
jgi:hypothetical protein